MFTVNHLKYRGILEIESLTVDRQLTCIVGTSGSGKTTLLRMFNRMNAPDEGSVCYNGKDLAALDAVELRRKVVMLGQTPVIYSGSLEDNLQIGLVFSQKPPASRAELEQSLRRVGLEKAPEELCGNLSGGEKQRLCLARVLLMNAETYLLDEPSAALDKETEQFIIQNLVQFVRESNKQLIMVTHSENIAALYHNSILRITAGRTEGYENEQ